MNNIQFDELSESSNFNDLFQLSIDFFKEYELYDDDLFLTKDIERDTINSYFKSFLNSSQKKCFIAISDQIVGYITIYIKNQGPMYKIENVGEISGLMVNKNFRHRGIAKKLVEKAEDFFKKNNIQNILLFTSINNIDGINFYKSLGMQNFQIILRKRL